MIIVTVRAIKNRDHYEIIHYFSIFFIGNAALVSAMWLHTSAVATPLAYKVFGGYIFEGGNDPLFLIRLRAQGQKKPGERRSSIHRLFLSLPH